MPRRSNPNKPKKIPTGDYDNGYARPPKHGQIKPGEKRNPSGINRKKGPAMTDPFENAMNRLVAITIDGSTIQVSAEQAIWLKNSLVAMSDPRVFRIVAEERRSRRSLAPVPPTAADRAAEAEESEQKKKLSANLVQLLQEAAARKKRGETS